MNGFIGKTLGKVQIEALAGRGGVAEVYVGTHTTLDRKVAVKVLRNVDEDNADKLERFKREARVIAKLRHPNIVQVYDFDTIESHPYLVMEYIEGPSLSKYLNDLHQNRLRLPLHQVIRMIRAVASALQYAHNNGIVHRDVKPGNILLTSSSSKIIVGRPLPEDFEPVLTDFGLVRFQDGHRQTTTGHIAGTPAYMSPEQSRGEAVDGRADIYSLGIVLYEMLAGDVPFDGESTVSILLKQVTEPPRPITGISPQLQTVLNRALAKDVKDRFQTPLELADAFSAAAGSLNLKREAATIEFTELPTILPSDSLTALKIEKPKVEPLTDADMEPEEPAAKKRGRWLFVALPVIIAIALGGFFWMNGLPSSAPDAATTTAPAATYTTTYTILPPTEAGTATAVLPTGPIGVLHFQNASLLADQASLTTQGMPAPQPGNQYEVWLLGADDRLSLGILALDEKGIGKVTFADPGGLNLISRFDALEITIEPNPDTDPASSGLVAYSFTLPEEGMVHVRYLLSEFAGTPDKIGLAQGLYADIKQIDTLTKEMQNAFESGDQETVKQKAELALNLLVGAKSADYKDWDGNGKKEPRSSYGLVLNGNSFGYIQSVSSEIEVTIKTAGATESMIANGNVVKTCAQNLAQWAPQLREVLLTVINATDDSSRETAIRAAVALTDQMLHGIDLDKNGKVDAISGECGAETAYEAAYSMADMPIQPASLSYQLTVVANSTPIPTSATKKSGGTSIAGTPAAVTPKVQPTKKPNPTKKTNPGGGTNPDPKPKPTKKK